MLDEDDVFIAVLATAPTAAVRFCEALLIERLDPVLGGLGRGSKVPGVSRPGRRSSPVDAPFPGWRWATAVTPLERARAHLRVVSHLARFDPGGPRWAPLVEVEGQAPRRAAKLGRTTLRALPGGWGEGAPR